MADTMQQFGNPPTYEQLQQMRETSTQLRQSVRDYLAYKQEVHQHGAALMFQCGQL